jgi:hypothetical protein
MADGRPTVAKPKLTEFLLKLATDLEVLKEFDSSDESRRRVMDAAGLTEKQKATLATRDSTKIVEEVIAELRECASTGQPFLGTGIMIVVPIVRHILEHISLHFATPDE